MAIILPELILESIFREGLEEVSNDPDKLNDWLSLYNESYLEKSYGQKTIDDIRNFFKKDVHIMQGDHDIPSKVPCICIDSLNFDEAQDKTYLGDYGFTIDENIENRIIVKSLQPVSYDLTTGWLTLQSSSNLSAVTINHLYSDSAGNKYTIYSIIDRDSDKRLNIGTGIASVDVINPGNIVSIVSVAKSRHLVTPVNHRLNVSVHTSDPFMTKNLHYVCIYMLSYYKFKMIQRGLEISTWAATEFFRDPNKIPDHIFSRSIDVYVTTFANWRESQELLADGSNSKVRVEKDIYDREDGDIFTVDTVE